MAAHTLSQSPFPGIPADRPAAGRDIPAMTTSTVSRRALLTGAVAIVPFLATAAAASIREDPALALAREWWKTEDAINAGVSDVESDALMDDQDDIIHRLFVTPSASVAGLAAKLRILGQLHGLKAGDDIAAQSCWNDGMMISVMRDADRLASRRGG